MSSIHDFLLAELPQVDPGQYDRPFEEAGVDSFDLIALRTSVEAKVGSKIADARWTELRSISEIVTLLLEHLVTLPSTDHTRTQWQESRQYEINMPQMALGGLSESWLFKELGDMHWKLIAGGLGTSSSNIRDGNGDRLYATFTRFLWKSGDCLAHYKENDPLELAGFLERYGSGIFLGTFRFGTEGSAQLMSSFSKRGGNSNDSLLKGQPTIGDDCPIPEIDARPRFIDEYRERRQIGGDETQFSTRYDLYPFYDINGVGLLYFAAFPGISSYGELKFFNYIGINNKYSISSRDVCYFSNCNADDFINYDVLRYEIDDKKFNIEAMLRRGSDDKKMAHIITKGQFLAE